MENNEIIVQEQQMPSVPNMNSGVMAQLDNINQGTVAIEASRAIAEAQGKLVIAKRFPRDEVQAYIRVAQACQRKGIAEKAFYSYSRGGGTVSGPTIRFAEDVNEIEINSHIVFRDLKQWLSAWQGAMKQCVENIKEVL